jgi:phospholipid/cholesterol/gamma-HCH transport system substrate-binding protein
MKTGTNHWKLGLFVVTGVGLALLTALLLGARSLRHDTIQYSFYFEESVQGLDVGSAAKFRGVTIGTVSAVRIGPDHRSVEVLGDMDEAELSRLNFIAGTGRNAKVLTPPDLRVQLASQGVTGAKFLQFDFYDPAAYPPPKLAFPTPKHYVPSVKSTLKGLEERLVSATERLPEIMGQITAAVTQVNTLLRTLDPQALTQEAIVTLRATQKAIASLERNMDAMRLGKLAERTDVVLTSLGRTSQRLEILATQLSEDKGLVVSAQRTSLAVGELARSANGMSTDMGETLRSMREAADAFQRLAQSLERDPDQLLKGRKAAP